MMDSMGKQLKKDVHANAPLPVLGAVNAYTALLAKKAGAKALYLSGAGVANASYGLPDLGLTGLADVLVDVRRIMDACPMPMLVDVDTGFGNTLSLTRTVKCMEQAGVAAIHIEDQPTTKRCGHRPNKSVVSLQKMGDRIKAAVDARVDPDFVIMARTDAFAVEGMQSALDRAAYCVELGADMVFPEALTTLDQYQQFTAHLQVPVLANITEFGKTPLFTRKELKTVGVQLILYPLSAFRAMSFAALDVYGAILQEGTQQGVLERMQTRDELYDVLNYRDAERIVDLYTEDEHGND